MITIILVGIACLLGGCLLGMYLVSRYELEPLELHYSVVVASRDYMEREMEFYKGLYREKEEE